MASKNDESADPTGIGGRPADPFVRDALAGGEVTPPRVLRLSGLLGDSDRPGMRRLYLTKELDYYVEFSTGDVVSVESVPTDQAPFLGVEATAVNVRREAALSFTRTRVATPLDQFDLEVRLGTGSFAGGLQPAETWEAECPGPSWGGGCGTDFGCPSANDCPSGWTVCKPAGCRITNRTCATDCNQKTCDTCNTDCNQGTCNTCQTCATQCNQATCNTCQTCATQCNQGTCNTCNQGTCNTCNTDCGQATCGTCRTDCGGRTCVTCDTCNPHVFTCGPNPQC
jgi:hypothetical protein